MESPFDRHVEILKVLEENDDKELREVVRLILEDPKNRLPALLTIVTVIFISDPEMLFNVTMKVLQERYKARGGLSEVEVEKGRMN